ncbi:hypothetical protein [Mycolicibacterium lutetiense]|jgi:hypothetical protein|uniref:Uncharacterized protein n=1 Tax=Mycolicibacterium lutetiense TaxID=1641992 RepID=A0ABS4ZYX1_9MYCO|nr:hypothetical protein [Mycolicibacterium lutetiense]MBP2454710.1 hypothetical protein [Mycolicibacterium lutetiense]MDT0522243.1 hypothetical protein [Streptomyces sp. DSM 41633]
MDSSELFSHPEQQEPVPEVEATNATSSDMVFSDPPRSQARADAPS